METEAGIVEEVTKTDILLGFNGLASWNKPRSTEELLDFINRHETEIANIDE